MPKKYELTPEEYAAKYHDYHERYDRWLPYGEVVVSKYEAMVTVVPVSKEQLARLIDSEHPSYHIPLIPTTNIPLDRPFLITTIPERHGQKVDISWYTPDGIYVMVNIPAEWVRPVMQAKRGPNKGTALYFDDFFKREVLRAEVLVGRKASVIFIDYILSHLEKETA